ncbi:MAG TPA: Mur ligase domain-containing protein [Baekduia sp.]|nr:Mur ligase domain-containing protein [Baekduia sp.]
MNWNGRRIHLIGIGGAGMSGYARVCAQLGATVSGSDREDSEKLEQLRGQGIEAFAGHRAEQVPLDADVFYSSAIAADNPERLAAGGRAQPRAELLRELTAQRRTIAIAGAHGKTTTSAMVTHILQETGNAPGYLIGGELVSTGQHADLGAGEWLVVEADESDRSLLALNVEIALILNIEHEHVDQYATLAELEAVYEEFAAHATQPPAIDRDWTPPQNVETGPWGSRFKWSHYDVTVPAFGEHNASNAVAAIEVCVRAGVAPAAAVYAIGSYAGVRRRFERVGVAQSGAIIVSDYAHHPTEVEKTITAARSLRLDRVIAVFQPHLFSRTRDFAERFSTALHAADHSIVLPVYPSRERQADFPGVTSELIGASQHVHSFAQAQEELLRTLRHRDLCLMMGAGDIDVLARRIG